MRDKFAIEYMSLEDTETKCDECGKPISGNEKFKFRARFITNERKFKTKTVELCATDFHNKKHDVGAN